MLLAADVNVRSRARSTGQWLSDNPANAGDGFRVMTAFYRVVKAAAEVENADVTLIDLGPNVGAMNRAALVAADYVVIPLGADLFLSARDRLSKFQQALPEAAQSEMVGAYLLDFDGAEALLAQRYDM